MAFTGPSTKFALRDGQLASTYIYNLNLLKLLIPELPNLGSCVMINSLVKKISKLAIFKLLLNHD